MGKNRIEENIISSTLRSKIQSIHEDDIHDYELAPQDTKSDHTETFCRGIVTGSTYSPLLGQRPTPPDPKPHRPQ